MHQHHFTTPRVVYLGAAHGKAADQATAAARAGAAGRTDGSRVQDTRAPLSSPAARG